MTILLSILAIAFIAFCVALAILALRIVNRGKPPIFLAAVIGIIAATVAVSAVLFALAGFEPFPALL